MSDPNDTIAPRRGNDDARVAAPPTVPPEPAPPPWDASRRWAHGLALTMPSPTGDKHRATTES